MADSRDDESMMDVARGDRAVNQYLRESLTVLRDNSQDKEFRRLVDDVLSGKASLREAAFTELFERAVGQPLQENLRHEERLSEAEIERLTAAGEAEFAQLNEQLEAEERVRAERDGRTAAAAAGQPSAFLPASTVSTLGSLTAHTPGESAAETPRPASHHSPAPQTIMPTVHGSDRFS
jgi:hypothetical protein